MRNRRLIEELIPVAIDKLPEVGIAYEDEDDMTPEDDKSLKVYKIPKAFNGYIASFATSIVQAGLKQSVLFFSIRGAAKEERGKIVELIYEVLKERNRIEPGPQSLNEYVTDAPAIAKGDILDAAVACKLAMRSFEQV